MDTGRGVIAYIQVAQRNIGCVKYGNSVIRTLNVGLKDRGTAAVQVYPGPGAAGGFEHHRVAGGALNVELPVGNKACAGGKIEGNRSEEHTSELQSRGHLVCRLLP